ncbi:MAG: tetratricopeptide repeat protein [Bacteroidetes bacterium]|nr:tetratricopeptide repeat protein [Bacteroidota bacterium]MBX7046882.1 tetratricopeptide repeat protein [Ignavibacteria bacterium]
MSENYYKSLVEQSKDYFNKAYKFQTEGLLEKAIENYNLSIELFPTPEAYTFLGWTYSLLGNYEKAIEECKNAIEIDSDYGNSYNDIGAYLIAQGKPDDAIPYIEMALNSKRYDSYHFAHLNLGRALEMKGLWLEAVEEYRKSKEIAPDYLPAKQNFNRLQGILN